MLNFRTYVFFLSLFAGLSQAYATHYRAGEISYRQLGEKDYEVTVVTYTDPKQNANSGTVRITIDWGDNSTSDVNRFSQEFFPTNANISKNTYIATHSYKIAGDYDISVSDQNRVADIENIPFSSNYAFFVSCHLSVNPTGSNNSVILSAPPIDDGCYGQIYVHNPSAVDPDGDSLAFSLVTPASGPNAPIMLYSDPEASSFIRIDPHTGQVVWDRPTKPTKFGSYGIYNIAIRVDEFRTTPRGKIIKVGSVVRDMQIWVYNCFNLNGPPVVAPMADVCVEAGKLVQFTVSATDPNPLQAIEIKQYGGPKLSFPNTSTLTPDPLKGSNPISGTFRWKTECKDIRRRAHMVTIKALDNYEHAGTDSKSMNITVVGPAPIRVTTKQVGSGFLISWARDTCRLAAQYKVYRRIDSSRWNPAQCETGVPAYTGFVQINPTSAAINPNDTSYYDNGNGDGLTPLINYCYRVVAVFPPRNGNEVLLDLPADGYASGEVCDAIIRSKPIITNVSITTTDPSNGALRVRWIRPDTLDTAHYLPPYRMIVMRKSTGSSSFVPVDSISYSSFAGINDTTIVDTFLNTAQHDFIYRIDFVSAPTGNRQVVDVSPTASSVKAIVYSTDKTNILSWQFKVPWINDSVEVFRKNSLGQFVSIGQRPASAGSFSDTGLVNGVTYCYILRTVGGYSPVFLPTRLVNFSQEICGTPIDTIRPCPPQLIVLPPCNSFNTFTNTLEWTPVEECSRDVVNYRVYFKQLRKDEYMLLGVVDNTSFRYDGNRRVFTYEDNRVELKKSIAGCYVVTGVDSVNNESFFLNETCIDNCPEYDIPNVFTPGNDGRNDVLHPFPYRFVDRIELQIYNRWGTVVYQTNNLDINWDGTDIASGEPCSDGVYFFICDVFETHLEGVKKRSIKGTVHLLRTIR